MENNLGELLRKRKEELVDRFIDKFQLRQTDEEEREVTKKKIDKSLTKEVLAKVLRLVESQEKQIEELSEALKQKSSSSGQNQNIPVGELSCDCNDMISISSENKKSQNRSTNKK